EPGNPRPARVVLRDPVDRGVDDVGRDFNAQVLARFVDVDEFSLHGSCLEVHLRAARYGGHSFAWRMLALRSSRAIAGERRSANGGTRPPIAFRLRDPKPGASPSSATFAHGQTSRLQRITVRRFARQREYAEARRPFPDV